MNELEQMKQREIDYLNEFEKGAKEFFAKITKSCNEPIPLDIISISSDSKIQLNQWDYAIGYKTILEYAAESIGTYINKASPQKDYPAAFKKMRNDYHQKYIALRKTKKSSFNDGRYQAAVDLYKGLDSVIQTAAEYDLNNLQEHQLQRASCRRR
jgi:hypothetical protein